MKRIRIWVFVKELMIIEIFFNDQRYFLNNKSYYLVERFTATKRYCFKDGRDLIIWDLCSIAFCEKIRRDNFKIFLQLVFSLAL